MVLTDQPLKQAIKSNDKTLRMAMFLRELDDFHIEYARKIFRKGQTVASFLVELHDEDPTYPTSHNTCIDPASWTFFVDDSNNMHGSSLKIVLILLEVYRLNRGSG